MSQKWPLLFFVLLFTLFINVLQTHGQKMGFWFWPQGALPGRSRNIEVWLKNKDVDISSVQFDFLFDASSLSVTAVEKYQRGEVFQSIDWDSLDSGIRVYLNDSGTVLPAGDGDVVKIVVRVGEHVPRGNVIDLTLANITVTDTTGNEIPLADSNKKLTVSVYDFEFYFGTYDYWGAPGKRKIKTYVYVWFSYNEASSIDFHVLYDTDVFTVSDVEKTYSSDIFAEFEWDFTEEGIHVSMSDSAAFMPEVYDRRIAEIYFNVDSAASEGWYDLMLDSLVIVDTTGNEVPSKARRKGRFYIELPTLKVTDGQGYRGSSGNMVEIDLENGFFVDAMQFDLLFDRTYLSVSDVKKTERNRMDLFAWSSIANGIRVAMTDFDGIDEGTGPIVVIFFDIDENAALGEYEMKLSDIVIGAFFQNHVDQFNLVDGTFRVMPQNGDVNGDGTVSVEDAITVVNIIIGFYEPTSHEFSAADCNDDYVVNVLDVVCIVNIILGNE